MQESRDTSALAQVQQAQQRSAAVCNAFTAVKALAEEYKACMAKALVQYDRIAPGMAQQLQAVVNKHEAELFSLCQHIRGNGILTDACTDPAIAQNALEQAEQSFAAVKKSVERVATAQRLMQVRVQHTCSLSSSVCIHHDFANRWTLCTF